MAFGYGPGANMQRDYQQNRAQLGKRKSLKEIFDSSGETITDPTEAKYKKMSEKEFKLFQEKLAIERKRDRKKSRILLFFLLFLGMVALGLMLME